MDPWYERWLECGDDARPDPWDDLEDYAALLEIVGRYGVECGVSEALRMGWSLERVVDAMRQGDWMIDGIACGLRRPISGMSDVDVVELLYEHLSDQVATSTLHALGWDDQRIDAAIEC